MFQRYQSVPSQVEAAQFTEANKDRVLNSLTGQYNADFEDGKPIIEVKTIHGEIAIVRLSDWIVKDEKIGTYYPVKDSVFRNKYWRWDAGKERCR